MSDAQNCGNGGGEDGARDSAAITDVLLVIDTATLLDKAAGQSPSPVSVDGTDCYRLSPGHDTLDGSSGTHAATWRIDARPGERIRMRWTALAMRGEQAVLLQLALADDAMLGNLQLHVEDNAVRYAPRYDKPEEAVARQAPDAYWQADVVASGEAETSVEATVTDRDANVLGRFTWSMRIAVA
ncbi:inclusion body protein [Pandoraea capi]|uniref:Inclusion body protein n=1 Tax=Pandoraea capi TaxID=2508286 RepID=A0ABY6VRI3_9BURK|nr:AidA/PixA family protein [Pandoraea capi]VVD79904.1 inclusion body protein [Pandoraea capi]